MLHSIQQTIFVDEVFHCSCNFFVGLHCHRHEIPAYGAGDRLSAGMTTSFYLNMLGRGSYSVILEKKITDSFAYT
jgi:hypothetical protein